MNRNLLIWFGLLVILLIAMLLWSMRGSDKGGSRARSPSEPDHATSGQPTAAQAPPVSTRPPPDPAARRKQWGDRINVTHPVIARFLETTKYPPSQGVLRRDMPDLLHPNTRHERRREIVDENGDPGEDPVSFLFTGDKFFLTGAEVFHGSLEAWQQGKLIPVNIVQATATTRPMQNKNAGRPRGAPALAEDQPSTAALAFQQDGLVYRCAFAPGQHFKGDHVPIRLEVVFEYGPGTGDAATLDIVYTPDAMVPARFTGSFDDELRDGSLIVNAGIEVSTAGFYVLRRASSDPG